MSDIRQKLCFRYVRNSILHNTYSNVFHWPSQLNWHLFNAVYTQSDIQSEFLLTKFICELSKYKSVYHSSNLSACQKDRPTDISDKNVWKDNWDLRWDNCSYGWDQIMAEFN